MIAAALLAMLASAAPSQGGGCADHWVVEVNRASFANNGAGRAFNDAQLQDFQTRIEAQLKSVIGGACQSGAVKAASARAIRRVEVSTASGASDPFLFSTAGGVLKFEWIFAEEDLAVPPAPEIVAGAACWTDPNGSACANSGD